MRILALISLLLLTVHSHSGTYKSPEWDSIQIELDDIKQALHTTQIDLSLLDERLKKPDKSKELSTQTAALEKRVASLEKTLEKILTDVRTLNTLLTQHQTQTEELQMRLSSHDDQLSQVGKLKTTLSTLVKSVTPPPSSPSTKTYTVKAGDSLEKIAKLHHTTAANLRKLNHLSQDKIIIGQELKVADDTP